MVERATVRLLYPTPRVDEQRLRRAVEGRIVLVTGASYGIGKATARMLGGHGATVLLVARSRDRLEEIANEIAAAGGTAEVHPADLSDPDSVAELAKEVLARHTHVDVVINNAGKSIRRAVDESYDRFHDFQRTIDVNYLGPVKLLLELLPSMRSRGEGHVVNVSTWGVRVVPAPRWSAYQASKTAFDVWLRAVAAEAIADGVTTTHVYMPLVRTRMSAPTAYMRNLPGLTTDDAAAMLCHAIVKRPRVIAPWWLGAFEVASDLVRGPAERGLAVAYRRTR